MIHLDTHPAPGASPAALSTPYDVLEGWFAWEQAEEPADAPSARAGGEALALQPVARPDLGPGAFAFRAYLSWSHILLADLDGILRLAIEGGPETHLHISPGLRREAEAARDAKAAKRAWLADHLRHPSNFAPVETLSRDALSFTDGTRFDQAGYGAVNVLDPSYGFSGHLADKTDGVSAHRYPTLLDEALEAERADKPGFMALDFGAGLKTVERADVIYMEIFDYPSTDVLCVGQALPFADATFDAVCTLAVLEHVDDPFACTAEIKRVLKPGGLVFSGVPFMQPEHGYPDHFFNVTRSGHAKLYKDLIDIEQQVVDDHQHPWLSLQMILRNYVMGLPEEARDQFRSMTVEDMLGHRYWRHRDTPLMAGLSEEARWQLASATTLIGRKKQPAE